MKKNTYTNSLIIEPVQYFILLLFLILINSCIEQFIPVIKEEKELLVVQGLITDQPLADTIKLSKSLPVGKISEARPLTGSTVIISDDLGNTYILREIADGTYITDPAIFKGEAGRLYTLRINTYSNNGNLNYESYPMEMKPVPPIDSLYYEKTVIEKPDLKFRGIEGCQIYLDTYDPSNNCKYFRWNYSETWVLRLPFDIPNLKCWIYDKSRTVDIKSTVAFEESRLYRHPVIFISNLTDRLKTKYSILVNQYSMNKDEYIYWEKIQNIAVQVGGLYDIIPASVPGNIRCIENPTEKVLGYFSVSAISSKRIFIKDKFEGMVDPYANCVSDTLINGPGNIEGLGIYVWTLFDIKPSPFSGQPHIVILTDKKGCADCTVRGTTKKPDFWIDDK